MLKGALFPLYRVKCRQPGDCSTAMFTAALDDDVIWSPGGNALSGPVSRTKDCLATTADGTVHSGWTVISVGQQVG